MTLNQLFTNIADAIRNKKGTSGKIIAENFPTEIGSIPSGSTYPPDWSELGYDKTPESVITDFNYAKQIKDNWDSSVTSLRSKYSGDRELMFMPLVDTSNVTDMRGMFSNCTFLTTIPLLNTDKVTDMNQMFYGCSSLTSIPLLDTSSVTNVEYMFQICTGLRDVPVFDFSNVVSGNPSRSIFSGCNALTNDSLNNILEICINMTSVTSNKTLKYVMGLTEEQATTCTTLSNHQAFLDAGWTTGY